MLVIFDIDDTLIDHTTAYRQAIARLRQDVASDVSLDEFVVAWSRAHRRYFDQFLVGALTYEEQARARVREAIDASLSDADADRCFAGYIEAYEHAWALFPDVEPCLSALSEHRLGVVSNGQREQQVRKLARTGILDRFDWVVVPADCGQPKPSAGIFQYACALAGEQSDQVVYIGDAYAT